MAKQSPQQVLSDEEAMYSVYQVAEQWGVNPESVKRWIRTNQLKAVLFPGSIGYRVRASAMQDYIARRELKQAIDNQLSQAS